MTLLKAPGGRPPCFMGLTRSPFDGSKPIPDAFQLPHQMRSVFERHRLGCQDDTEIVGPAVLPDVFVCVTEPAQVVGRQFWEQGDDVASISPATEDDLVTGVEVSDMIVPHSPSISLYNCSKYWTTCFGALKSSPA